MALGFKLGGLGGGSADDLYEALKYSGLVTPDMDYDQMLEVLTNYFPLGMNANLLTTNPSQWSGRDYGYYRSGLNGSTLNIGITKANSDHWGRLACTVPISNIADNTYLEYTLRNVFGNENADTTQFSIYVGNSIGATTNRVAYHATIARATPQSASISLKPYKGQTIYVTVGCVSNQKYQDAYFEVPKLQIVTN